MKYPRTYHFPFSHSSSEDKINYNWESILSHKIVVTEKLDGENTCLKKDGVYARSHSSVATSAWSKTIWKIWERVKDGIDDIELFGENLYGIHSIEYQNLDSYFYLFAVRREGNWLSWQDVKTIANFFELSTVPEIKSGIFSAKELQKVIEDKMKSGSSLGGECEGVVVRVENEFKEQDFNNNVLKYVRPNHVQKKEHWTRNWRRAKLIV